MNSEAKTSTSLLKYDEGDVRRWIGYSTKAEPSLAVMRCVGLLATWLGGTHHITDHISVRRIPEKSWTNKWQFIVCFHRDVSTFDFDLLTRLVFLAHDLLIRVELSAAAPRYLRITMSPRLFREGNFNDRHPTIEEALKAWRGNQTHYRELSK